MLCMKEIRDLLLLRIALEEKYIAEIVIKMLFLGEEICNFNIVKC